MNIVPKRKKKNSVKVDDVHIFADDQISYSTSFWGNKMSNEDIDNNYYLKTSAIINYK